ncbi:hypothetical protein [Brevibacillus brevis]|uniref:hypothetical protein n=2 Tax=Brevibacillus brevis TaxID=1393 RepID=UPI0007D8A92B|nr:hypothetical protein [Brevibacillus brevis]
MKALRLLAFEIKQQIRSLTFILVLCIFAIFIATQMNGVFHYPVYTNKDIKALEKSGELEYLFVPASEEELKSSTIQYLKNKIDNGSIPAEKAKDIGDVIQLLRGQSFINVYTAMQHDEYIIQWLNVGKSQFGQKVGSVEEVNNNLRTAIETQGYGSKLYEKYVTYMQICATFLIFPIFLLLFTRDSSSNMSEILYVQPLSSIRYILCRYFGALVPLLIFFYGFGIVLNVISTTRFARAGWGVAYTFFLSDFMVYILPTVVFLSALVMFLMILFKKAIAVFPIYIAYILFNVTPGAFEGGSNFGVLSRAIIRLDGQMVNPQTIMLNRGIYLLLTAGLLFAACMLYNRMKKNVRKAIAIWDIM